jgi:hypothetical protein
MIDLACDSIMIDNGLFFAYLLACLLGLASWSHFCFIIFREIKKILNLHSNLLLYLLAIERSLKCMYL